MLQPPPPARPTAAFVSAGSRAAADRRAVNPGGRDLGHAVVARREAFEIGAGEPD